MRRAALAAIGLLAAAPAAFGQSAATSMPGMGRSAVPHIRTEAADLRTLLHSAAAASPTLQALVERLEGSDLIVYVTARPLPSSINGRIGWIGTAGGLRVVKIELACPRTMLEQAASLAHELRHAVEIADAPDIIGPPSFAEHYARIGVLTRGTIGSVMFETDAARLTGELVRQELMSAPRNAVATVPAR